MPPQEPRPGVAGTTYNARSQSSYRLWIETLNAHEQFALDRRGQYTEFAADGRERFDGAVEMLALVCCGDLHSDAGLPLRHHRIEEPDDVDPHLQQALGEALCQRSVVEHDRH